MKNPDDFTYEEKLEYLCQQKADPIFTIKIPAPNETIEISQVVTDRAIIAEIAYRIKELQQSNAVKFIILMGRIAQESPQALILLVDFLTSDPEIASNSYTQIAKKKGISRQAVHKATQKSIKIIEKHSPGLGTTIKEILKHCHKATRTTIE
jgi:hypothetical protein